MLGKMLGRIKKMFNGKGINPLFSSLNFIFVLLYLFFDSVKGFFDIRSINDVLIPISLLALGQLAYSLQQGSILGGKGIVRKARNTLGVAILTLLILDMLAKLTQWAFLTGLIKALPAETWVILMGTYAILIGIDVNRSVIQ